MQADVKKFLGLDFKTNTPWLDNTYTLRKLIGLLGILLPLLLPLFLYMYTGHANTLESISHYYYTQSQSIFTIIISLMAIFLMIYKGKDPVDFYISFIAGFFALMVILFPTSNIVAANTTLNEAYMITIPADHTVRIGFHYISAAIFLGCLTYMSFFQFTKSNVPKNERTPEKNTRNTIYKICGTFMCIGLLVMVLGLTGVIEETVYTKLRLTFWMETLAVFSFGLSWLVKGEAILGDK
ncbi:hypothetical protein [Aureibaculum luteum]|uniref:hypothetical protein n=1 Tax=Aureibaculum luteum TaxID=1548456 RepID=UPI000E4BA6D4|nr:hypothetical protein [Aureibaculum luteum]